MGDDDVADCAEHLWVLAELDVSATRGATQVQRCSRCDATAYVTDPVRAAGRPPLEPVED